MTLLKKGRHHLARCPSLVVVGGKFRLRLPPDPAPFAPSIFHVRSNDFRRVVPYALFIFP